MSHRVRIHGQAFGGDAVARLPGAAEGKVVFLPFGAVGDVADVRILRDKRQFAHGEILKLIEEGDGRRAAKCPQFGECGGCQWQHLTAQSQAEAKETLLREFFPPSSPMMEGCEFRPLIVAPNEWQQRRRMRLQWRGQKLGFFRRESHDVMAIDLCPVIAPALQATLTRYRALLSGRALRCGGNMVMLANSRGDVHVSIRISEGVYPGQVDDFLISPVIGGSLSDKDGVVHAFGAPAIDLAGAGESAGGPWLSAASAFAQADIAQERVLQTLVASELRGHKRVLELFAGVGTLTRALAQDGRGIVAVESAQASSRFLSANCRVLPGDVDCLEVEAGRWLATATAGKFDAVVADPPREGCRRAMSDLVRLKAKKIVYVSCNPSTLKRDLECATSAGYGLSSIQGLDMMPQTYHLEVVAVLERNAP